MVIYTISKFEVDWTKIVHCRVFARKADTLWPKSKMAANRSSLIRFSRNLNLSYIQVWSWLNKNCRLYIVYKKIKFHFFFVIYLLLFTNIFYIMGRWPPTNVNHFAQNKCTNSTRKQFVQSSLVTNYCGRLHKLRSC